MRIKGGLIPGRHRGLMGLADSKKAQMPFSVATALLLVLSSVSIVLVQQMSDDRDGSPLPVYIAASMKQTASDISMEIKEAAYSVAVDTMKLTHSMNESHLHSAFIEGMDEYVNRTFPRYSSDLEILVRGTNISLRFLRISMQEFSPPLEETELKLNYSMITVPAYFFIAGNFIVEVHGYGSLVVHNDEMEESLLLPFPLVADRLNALSSAMSGGRCEFENLVRYQLVSLVQQRLLSGYGVGSRGGDEGTASVLTRWDVVRAANLALLLEQKKHLRSVDDALKVWVINASFDPTVFGPVLEKALEGGVLDPADMFLIMCGETEIDLSLLFAQSLYAGADVIVLKWLEFMHLLDLVEGIENLLEGGQLLLENVIESLTGADLLQEDMVNWILERVESIGYDGEYYRYMHYGWPDAIISVPEQRYIAFNDLNQTFDLTIGGTYQIDFPSWDIFSSSLWGGFLEEFRKGRFQLGEMLEDFVKGVVVEISSSYRLSPLKMELDPFDEITFIEELENIVNRSLADADWFDDALLSSMGRVDFKDRLAESLIEFMQSSWMDLFGWNESLQVALIQVVDCVMEEISRQIPDFGTWSSGVIRADLTAHLRREGELGIGDDLESIYYSDVGWRMDILRRAFEDSPNTFQSDMISGFLGEMIAGIVENLPGLKSMLLTFVKRQVDEIKDSLEMRCDPIRVHLPTQDRFELEVEEGVMIGERLELGTASNFFMMEGGNELDVTITMPWDQPRDPDEQSNRHITDLDNLTLTPFSSQWSVELRGMVKVSIIPRGISFPFLVQGISPGGEMVIPVHTLFTVTPTTGWALRGVDYTPTSTLFGQICKFMESLWQGVLEVLKIVSDGISQVFDFLKNLFSTLLTYSMKALGFLSEVLETLVSGLQEILNGVTAGTLNLISGLVDSVLGAIRFNTTIFGIRFCIETNVLDLALGATSDLLKVTFSMSILGSILSISNRIVRLGDGDYDILVNCTLATEDWSVSLVVDPLMKIFSHFVEVKGIFQGYVLLLYLPQVIQFERQTVSLSRIPGLNVFLSNIPTPIPGVKAKVDAGLEIKFTQPFQNHPLINEYEQNPPGMDAGAEWVELYNPSDQPIDLSGWSIETSHGDQRLEGLGEIFMMPRSRLVLVFKTQTLDNGGESKFPLSECIVLKDADGNRVDSTPWTTDHHNDERTWQRSFDGSDRWEFKKATRGISNGKRTANPNEIEFLRKAVQDSAIQAFHEMEGAEPSMDSLAIMIGGMVDRLRSSCVEMLASCIVEMRLFVEVSLTDLSSSLGAGFSLSLVITDRCVEETLLWLSDAIFSALKRLINPTGVVVDSFPMERLLENTFVRFSVFGEGGMPSIFSRLADTPSLRLEAMIEANLACFQIPSDDQVSSWRLGFGVLMTGVPSGLLPNLFAIDQEKMVDLWFVKGYVFSS